MANENDLKFGLTIGLIVAIVIYHITDHFVDPVNDLYDLFKVVQLAAVIAVYLLVIFNKPLVQLVLRSRFIDGKYEGKSSAFDSKDRLSQDDGSENIEKFVITQNLFETRIQGKSFNLNGDLASIWTGRLFRVEGETHYFGLDLTVDAGEVGVLQLIREGDTLDGFYVSGKLGTEYVYKITATRVDK